MTTVTHETTALEARCAKWREQRPARAAALRVLVARLLGSHPEGFATGSNTPDGPAAPVVVRSNVASGIAPARAAFRSLCVACGWDAPCDCNEAGEP